MRKTVLVGACALAWLLACSDDSEVVPTTDAGVDAAPTSDAAIPDSAAPDTSVPDASDPNDGFTAAEWQVFRGLTNAGTKPPVDTTNKYGDDAAAAKLGQMLFYDPSYSGALTVGSDGANGGLGAVGETGKVACVSCHSGAGTEDARSKPNNVSLGAAYGTRNALSLTDASYQTWTNWGGRFDSQWSLPPTVAENPVTMNGTRLQIVHLVYDKYRTEYEAVFGALDPAITNTTRFPLVGKPGQPAWDGMSDDPATPDKTTATRVFVNFGKAIAAYMRLLVSKNAPFDRYVAGDRAALDAAQKRGLRVFVGKGACVACHSGPAFTDGKFHALAVPQVGANVPATDLGRFQDVPALLASPLNVNGAFSDDKTTSRLTGLAQGDAQKGQFRTPGLRGIAKTGPYMHTGQLGTLAEVIAYYDKGGADPGDSGITKDALFKPLALQGTESADLASFLGALTGEPLPAVLLQDTHKP